jgi:hypothetical protein
VPKRIVVVLEEPNGRHAMRRTSVENFHRGQRRIEEGLQLFAFFAS